MPVYLLVVLLSLTSQSATSAPDCTELVKPLLPDNRSVVLGKWVFVIGSADPEYYLKALELLKSSWVDLSVGSDSDAVVSHWRDSIFNRCVLGSTNVTKLGDTITFTKNLSTHKGKLLQTCSDCLLWSDNFRNGDVTGRYLMHYTRTGNMDPKDIEMFKKQAVCLNFPEKYHIYDGTTELCADNSE